MLTRSSAKEVTKVVPTDAHKAAQDPGSKLYFELVRNDEKPGVWNQIIYDKHGKPVDITHLQLSTNMSFWRAEYYCAECPKGTQKHTVLYENIEIEVDNFDEHATPAVQCQGQGKATNVHKKDKSRYAHKNKSGVDYKGVIFSIDRVTLGKFDAKGKGGLVAVTENQVAASPAPCLTIRRNPLPQTGTHRNKRLQCSSWRSWRTDQQARFRRGAPCASPQRIRQARLLGLHLQRRPHAAVLSAPCLFAGAPPRFIYSSRCAQLSMPFLNDMPFHLS